MHGPEKVYRDIKNIIPRPDDRNWNPPSTQIDLEDKELNRVLVPFGFNLLLEMTFVLIAQCKTDVMPYELRYLILEEYRNILSSLVKADLIFNEKVLKPLRENNGCFQKINQDDFNQYFV